jgi:hypothetical protein
MRTLTAFCGVIFITAAAFACKHQRSVETSTNAAATQSSSDNEFAIQMRRDLEPKLKAVLPAGWSISNDSNSITLARDEKVFIYSSLQWPAYTDKSMDEMVLQYGQQIIYRLTLRFIPRLNQPQYAALKQAWLDCRVDNKPGPTFSIERWEQAQNCYHTKQPPIYYTDRYTIYLDQPDWWPALKIYPNAAANESNRLHASLDELFNRYEKAETRN